MNRLIGIVDPSEKMQPEQTGRFRHPKGVWGLAAKVALGAVPLWWAFYVLRGFEALGIALYKEQYCALFLTHILFASFIVAPATRKGPRDKVPWYDAVFAFLALVSGGYVVILYPQLAVSVGIISLPTVIFGSIMIITLLESCRRLMGKTITSIGILFLAYMYFGYLLPGMLNARPISLGRVVTTIYLDPVGIMGMPLSVVALVVFGFIFFGRIFFEIGGGQFLGDLAMGLTGKYKGGPAKVAVVSSSLFGTLSGVATANVAMTGVITIPLMKKLGYPSHYAAAVEAVASTGGLIMPPIMAATAFIMAEFLRIPYAEIATAAIIPAVMYYLALFMQVHLQAAKRDLKGLSPDMIPSVRRLMHRGWVFCIPPLVLVYALFFLHLSPENSSLYALASTLIIGVFLRGFQLLSPGNLWNILRRTGEGLIEVGIVSAVVGFIIGSMSYTGLGVRLSGVIVALSGGNVFLLLVMAAAVAYILGMGIPVTAAYITLAVLVAPALIQLGINPLAAHLFLMYSGCSAFITPPVAMAAYVGATIADADFLKTSFVAMRLAIAAYIVPFIFALSPSLILLGPAKEIVLNTVTACLGIMVIAVVLEGYLFARIGVLKRVLFALGGIGLLWPGNLTVSMVGLGLTIALVLWEWQAVPRQAAILKSEELAKEG